MAKLGGAGDRFGDYLCVDCANLPSVSGHNLQTQNSPDLLPKFRSLCVRRRGRYLKSSESLCLQASHFPTSIWTFQRLSHLCSATLHSTIRATKYFRDRDRGRARICNSQMPFRVLSRHLLFRLRGPGHAYNYRLLLLLLLLLFHQPDSQAILLTHLPHMEWHNLYSWYKFCLHFSSLKSFNNRSQWCIFLRQKVCEHCSAFAVLPRILRPDVCVSTPEYVSKCASQGGMLS